MSKNDHVFNTSSSFSAIYSAFRTYYYNAPTLVSIRTVDEAIKSLNANVDTQEALRFLQDHRPDSSYLQSLCPRALGVLALRGSELCKYVPVSTFDKDDSDLITPIYRVACPEEDLSCPDEWFARRPSQVWRLLQLLRLLFVKTEFPFNPSMIGGEILPLLYLIFTQFREKNKELSLLALKILANVALNEWLPLLASLVNHGVSLEERLLSHKICQNGLNTLGVLSYQLRSDVYELFLPDKEPVVDIILIHGLCGSVAYTWRQKDHSSNVVSDCWPKDWLHLDISDPMRILGFDYPSYIMQFTGAMESLQVRADRFKHQLEAAGVGKRPVIFICHSMGGLLAKRLLLDLPGLAKKTVGLLFIATPHRGSPIASWGYSILHPTADVLFLLEENPVNKKLNEDFSTISGNIPVIVSMVETKESDLIGAIITFYVVTQTYTNCRRLCTAKGIIVPTQSAVYEKGAVYHIEEVHHNVCKPSERTSASYGVVLNFVRDSIQAAKKMKYRNKEK
ncbi:unnamed protein product [Angiostrongylus costaricensis]|uniref:GPI inositol-deacylase n=1 Tax=Angiostrongylus costaricensis TaxID=334426 RepID=A0A0R3PEI8_ANGCS|nr:unnamed protein product [Angiostrongylus costaricensis]